MVSWRQHPTLVAVCFCSVSQGGGKVGLGGGLGGLFDGWSTWAAAEKSTQAGALTALTVRRTRRPCPVSTLEKDGTFFQGRALRVRCRVFWLPRGVRRYDHRAG